MHARLYDPSASLSPIRFFIKTQYRRWFHFFCETNDPRVIALKERPRKKERESSTLPFKKCKFVNASNGGVKICSLSLPLSACPYLLPPFLSLVRRLCAPTLLPERLLSNTKNQIKYAKLRFEDFGESKLPRGRRNIFLLPLPPPNVASTPADCSRRFFVAY